MLLSKRFTDPHSSFRAAHLGILSGELPPWFLSFSLHGGKSIIESIQTAVTITARFSILPYFRARRSSPRILRRFSIHRIGRRLSGAFPVTIAKIVCLISAVFVWIGIASIETSRRRIYGFFLGELFTRLTQYLRLLFSTIPETIS